jgi:hypothetical protein
LDQTRQVVEGAEPPLVELGDQDGDLVLLGHCLGRHCRHQFIRSINNVTHKPQDTRHTTRTLGRLIARACE